MRDDWPIGCFNRPWSPWSYDTALDGMRDAGYTRTGILGDHVGEPFTMPDATPTYLTTLRKRIHDRGLTPIIGWLKSRHDIPMAESIAHAAAQVENARRLGLKYMLTVGVDDPSRFDHYCSVMSEVARRADHGGIQIALKPHGGCSAAAAELRQCVERVGRTNYRLWFDAGNIVHYTGRDPGTEAAAVASWVTGFCAKDCAAPGGDVMLQFGSGKVKFRAVFAALRAGAFRGPVLMECCAGRTPDEVTSRARENRLYLERLFAELQADEDNRRA